MPTGQIRRHHEVYLSDPRKVSLDKLKTVIRHSVEYKVKLDLGGVFTPSES